MAVKSSMRLKSRVFPKKLKSVVKRNIYKYALQAFTIITGIYLAVFFITFNKPSDNISDYSAFATYLGGLGSIASIATLIVILIENHRLLQNKKDELQKQNLQFLVDHFEINQIETEIISKEKHESHDFENIKTTYINSDEYRENLRMVFIRIQYIYDNYLALKDYKLIDIIKNVILNKIPRNVLDSLIHEYSDEDCITWLKLDNIRWQLNISSKSKRE